MRVLKKFRWFFILVAIFGVGVIIVKTLYVPKESSSKGNNNPLIDVLTDVGYEYRESLKQEESDISGMTKYDKYVMGLKPDDASDSDGDGLTDKEEIEIYKSDPLKKSTAGDLYEDGYKAKNNMDIHEQYEYSGEHAFNWNECDEVLLSATKADDFYAVVKNITGSDTFPDTDILAEYRLYNYSGEVGFNTANVDYDPQGVAVLVEMAGVIGLEKSNLTFDADVVTLDYKFDDKKVYKLFIVPKEMADTLLTLFGVQDSSLSTSNKNENMGSGIIIGCPLLGYFLGPRCQIWVEDIGEYTDIAKQSFVDVANEEWATAQNSKITTLEDERISIKSREEIESRYRFLKTIVPFCEYTTDDNVGWIHLFFAYKTLENTSGFKEMIQTAKSDDNKSDRIVVTTGFDINKDELPFGNFASYIAPKGNCAGIAHFTTMLFNNKNAPSSGMYEILTLYPLPENEFGKDNYFIHSKGVISWDISNNQEESTLCNPNLNDYKDSSFLHKHNSFTMTGQDVHGNTVDYPETVKIIDYESLSDGEKGFVDMIGCYWQEANNASKGCTVYKSLNGGCSYQTIEIVKSKIDSGKVVDIGTNVVGGGGHRVTAYAYEYSENDPDELILYIYDSNFPNMDESQCKMVITKCLSVNGTESFIYEYRAPSKEGKEGYLLSNTVFGEESYFNVFDEKLNLLTEP